MADKRGLWRANFYASNGAPETALVVAVDGAEVAAFLGIRDSSGVQIVRDRYPVEVIGLDAPHASIEPIPVIIPPVQPPRQFTDAEISSLRALLRPQAKVSGGPTPAVVGTNPTKE